MLSVVSAEYVQGYELKIRFSDGNEGIADLQKTVFGDERSVFSPLRDKHVFARFRVCMDTVVWDNDLDLAPEYLYFQVLKDRADPELLQRFMEWGYVQRPQAVP